MEELARGRGCEAASGGGGTVGTEGSWHMGGAASGGGGGTVGTEEVLAVKEGGHGAQLLGDPLEMLQGGVGRLRGCNEMRGAHRRMVAAPWVGSARATAAGASVCSAPRTSTKIESERGATGITVGYRGIATLPGMSMNLERGTWSPHEDDFGLRLVLGEEFARKRETKSAAEGSGKWEHSESVVRSRGKGW
ncbi:hypothetical protein BGY98DRAFT_940072 [Russula aff. rugulosa BPL654]|nr:hypothetical protein BGY98DRAFT_940072 [Russula aff. rugulosa BPL654]